MPALIARDNRAAARFATRASDRNEGARAAYGGLPAPYPRFANAAVKSARALGFCP